MRTFEAACRQGYIELPCYRVGAMAVHKRPWELITCVWYVSHADTGMAVPGIDELVRLRDARRVAAILDAATDWSRLKRGAAGCEIIGMTDEMRIAIRDARDAALREVASAPRQSGTAPTPTANEPSPSEGA